MPGAVIGKSLFNFCSGWPWVLRHIAHAQKASAWYHLAIRQPIGIISA
jgi:hypothetical protein